MCVGSWIKDSNKEMRSGVSSEYEIEESMVFAGLIGGELVQISMVPKDEKLRNYGGGGMKERAATVAAGGFAPSQSSSSSSPSPSFSSSSFASREGHHHYHYHDDTNTNKGRELYTVTPVRCPVAVVEQFWRADFPGPAASAASAANQAGQGGFGGMMMAGGAPSIIAAPARHSTALSSRSR